MIIFYNKDTGDILGTVEGRVHFPEQDNMTISIEGLDQTKVGKLVIGWKEDQLGRKTPQNMHLWTHQLAFEDPKNPRHPVNERVQVNPQGVATGFTNRPT